MTLAFPSRSASLAKEADAILKSDAKLDWKPVDVDSMPDNLRQLYTNYKEAQRIASEHRAAFEDAACTPIGRLLSIKPGQDVAFGYRFGQLSVALTTKRTSPAKANALRF
jgi:hypothetical protein